MEEIRVWNSDWEKFDKKINPQKPIGINEFVNKLSSKYIVATKSAYFNIYEDDEGRFISNEDYNSYESAFENKDDVNAYKETVAVVKINK